MNIVITGGTGFIGQAIADLYIKAGHHVFVTGHEAPVPVADYLGRDFQQVDFSKLPTLDILNHQVDYDLTPLGRVFLEPVASLCAWAQAHKGDLEAAHVKRKKGRTKK